MDMMNVGSALLAAQSAPMSSVPGQVSMKMLSNTIDMNEQMSANMMKMMEQSVNPHIGGNFDAYA